MFGQPQYYNYPPNVSYNPHLHSSYQRPSPFEPIPSGYPVGQDRFMQDRARALAEQRLRRSQYLPDEDDEDEDDWEYDQLGPRERAYVDAKKRQDMLERRQQQEALERQRALEEQRQKVLAFQEERERALEQKQREVEARQRLLEEQRNQMRKEEEAHRQVAGEREKSFRQQQQPQPQWHRSPSRGPAQQAPPVRHGEGPVPINVRQPSSQPSTTEQKVVPPTSRPANLPSKATPSIEEQNAAASQIQKQYRIHTSSKVLDGIATQFENLKKDFVYPRVVDFKKPGSEDGHISVPACRPPSDFDNEEEQSMDEDGPGGKPAYTSTNYRLHQYTDALVKLLMKLDGVESWGDKGLRMKRREVVKVIEKEASKLERYWKQAWVDYMAKEKAKSEQP